MRRAFEVDSDNGSADMDLGTDDEDSEDLQDAMS
jgi:hypothetical protein